MITVIVKLEICKKHFPVETDLCYPETLYYTIILYILLYYIIVLYTIMLLHYSIHIILDQQHAQNFSYGCCWPVLLDSRYSR